MQPGFPRWKTLSRARKTTVMLLLGSAGLMFVNHWLWSLLPWAGLTAWLLSLACVIVALVFAVKPARK